MVAASIQAIALLLTFPAGTAAPTHDVEGHWFTPDKASIVQISDCGDGTPCGEVVWVDAHSGGMTADVHNHDASLRGRSMVGVTLLSGFQRGPDLWEAGEIYNPENGRTYRARLERLSDDELGVSGCLGPVCKKLVWERASSRVLEAKSGERSGDIASL